MREVKVTIAPPSRVASRATGAYLAGMIRPILLHPDPRLKKRCVPVGTPSPAHRALAEDMLATMYDAPGVGLAAPQVGEMVRLLVMDCMKEEGAAPRPMVLIDPEVVDASEAREMREEGCLSIPEHYADVERPAAVTVRWTDLGGERREERFDGLWSTCVQHEIDHLDGRLFIDYLGPMKRQLITRRMTKLKKERARVS